MTTWRQLSQPYLRCLQSFTWSLIWGSRKLRQPLWKPFCSETYLKASLRLSHLNKSQTNPLSFNSLKENMVKNYTPRLLSCMTPFTKSLSHLNGLWVDMVEYSWYWKEMKRRLPLKICLDYLTAHLTRLTQCWLQRVTLSNKPSQETITSWKQVMVPTYSPCALSCWEKRK